MIILIQNKGEKKWEERGKKNLNNGEPINIIQVHKIVNTIFIEHNKVKTFSFTSANSCAIRKRLLTETRNIQ